MLRGRRFVFQCLSGVRQAGVYGAVLADGMGLGKTFQTIASLYCLLTKGVVGVPTCRSPLILCPTSLVQVGPMRQLAGQTAPGTAQGSATSQQASLFLGCK